MFPLSGKNYPRSVQELSESLVTAMEQLVRFPDRRKVINITGGSFPSLDQVKINLTDAMVVTEELPPRPEAAGDIQPGVKVTSLEVLGHPIRHQAAKVDLSLRARGLNFDFARDRDGIPMLLLQAAESGQVEVRVTQPDLQSLVASVAAMIIKPHGIVVQELAVNLAKLGPRTVEAQVRVKAKKAFVSGTLLLRARVDVDDELIATVSSLSVNGDGMIGKLAAGALKGKLGEIEGEKIPLTTFSLGDVRLHDLTVLTHDGLCITAEFGSAAPC
jgi:hypothetical protein